jgi:ABC-2 type transporter
MTGSRFRESTSHRSGVRFTELLKVQARLALREPYGLLGGIALPVVLLAVFGFIGRQVPGNVGDTGLTIIDLWTPTILVFAFLYIAVSLPTTLVRDREIGWLRRVSTTPLHPSMLLAAQLIIDLVLAAAAVLIIILGGALVLGASLHVQILPFVISTGTGGRPLADDHVLLAERRGGKGSARCGLQRQPFLCGAAHHGRLHGHVRLHSDSLLPLGVARLPRTGDFPGEMFSYRQSKKITGIFSGGDDNDT